jgi:hypothetical protein
MEDRLQHVDVVEVAGAEPGVVRHQRRRPSRSVCGRDASASISPHSVGAAVPVNEGTL